MARTIVGAPSREPVRSPPKGRPTAADYGLEIGEAGKRPPKRRRPPRPQLAANGRSSVTLNLSLPRNALLDRLRLRLTADRSELARASAVADVRLGQSPAGKPAVIVDFGAMRTVNRLLLPDNDDGHRLFVWLGNQYDARNPLALGSQVDISQRDDAQGVRQALYHFTVQECRSERLLIELAAGSAAQVAELLELGLPELPASLRLRLADGTLLWEQPGPVQPGSATELNETGWTDDGQRLVDVTDTLAAQLGDATASGNLDLAVELSSQVPGDLQLSVADREYRLLHRLRFGEREQLTLDWTAEGEQRLSLPASAQDGQPLGRVSALQCLLSGEMPAERVLPAVGPASNPDIELVLGNGRAACMRLGGGSGLALLAGLRLPLRAGGERPLARVLASESATTSGAEARVVLWRSEAGLPVEPLEGGVSQPVSWEGTEEQWLSFRFDEPLAFDPLAPPWAALVVSRGQVGWRLAAADSEAAGDLAIRLGAPDGPWRALPGSFGVAQPLGLAVARLRLVGLSAETAPLAPLLARWDGTAVVDALTPTADGQRLLLESGNPAAGGLTLTSRVAGQVTLSEVDAITAA